MATVHRVTAANPDLLRRAAGADGATTFAASPGTIAFVAVDGDDVQGWCWGYLLPRPDGTRMAYLHHLEVIGRWRRRGVGRQLLRAFLDAGAGLGATRMFLITGEDNLQARQLYESTGATPAAQGPTVNYWWNLTEPGA